MAESSLFWDGAAGDGGPYGDDDVADTFLRALLNGDGNQGVLAGWLNELLVSDGGGLNAAVATGGAIVYGLGYENTTAATVVLPPSSTVWVVVRRSWAASTARLAQVAALVQTPTVTYDIPLAQVTTGVAAITLITDARDYCEFSTTLAENSLVDRHFAAGAITPAKMVDQTRSLFKDTGAMIPDATNPATLGQDGTNPYIPYYEFDPLAPIEAVWLDFRVPADYDSGTIELLPYFRSVGDVFAGATIHRAQASGLWSNATITNLIGGGTGEESLGTFTVTAGDYLHIYLYRDGSQPGDTGGSFRLLGVRLEYTADS